MKDQSFYFRLFCRSQSLLPLALVMPVLVPTVGISSVKAQPIQAQSVIAADDGTGTVVTQFENQIDITEGSFSADGINQFHSFDTFSVGTGQTANFVADPAVQNVLARVNGGTPSLIDGQVQIEGTGQPNLFLMNPAGILMGPEAHLNLPGSLTVTTADAIAFDQGDFSAANHNTYTTLTHTPTGEFVFHSAEPGSVVNAGALTVGEQASLTLLGGTVVNTGELATASGTVTLAAVPGESTIRITQTNSLLSLEITPAVETTSVPAMAEDATATSLPSIAPLDLPALLTASGAVHADSLSVNADGSVLLSTRSTGENGEIEGDIVTVLPESAIASGHITTTATTTNGITTAANVITGPAIGGNIGIFGEQVSLVDTTLSATGLNGGGTINIGGAHKGNSLFPSARTTFVNAGTVITADAMSRGDGGRVIVWADDTTQYLGDISAAGGPLGGNGGFVEVSGKESLAFRGTVDTRAPNGEVGSLLLDPEEIHIVNASPASADDQLLDGEILAAEGSGVFVISAAALESLSADTAIHLEATSNIVIYNLIDDALTFSPGNTAITFTADANRDGLGGVFFRDLNDEIVAPGRSLAFSGQFLLLGDISTVAPGRSGDVTLASSSRILAHDINTYSPDGTGGEVSIGASSDISTQFIRTESPRLASNVAITSQTGNVMVQGITANTRGNVDVVAPGSIAIQDLPLSEFLTTLPAPAIADLDYSALSAQLATLGAESAQVEIALSAAHSAGIGQQGIQRTELSSEEASAELTALDVESQQLFSDYFGREIETVERSLEEVQALLTDIEGSSGNRSAMVYMQMPAENAEDKNTDNASSTDSEEGLSLLLLTPDEAPLKIVLSKVTHEMLTNLVSDFRGDLITSARRGGDYYLAPAQQLYEWLIQPMEADLSAAGIDTLIFSMDEGLRALPIAALHDGESFLVEQYSLGMVPSVGMLNPQYATLADAQVLAVGMSNFDQHERLTPLPGVPLEVDAINQLWPGAVLLNEHSTQQNLISERRKVPYNVIHLATHAEFKPGNVEDSFVQLWDKKLSLSDLSQLGWQSPIVDLLVLSACNTALGSPEAEMGFAGLAIASGARSAMASLWSVSDVGTLALMNEFYAQLRTAPTKSMALQQAQLALLQGNIRTASGQLTGSETGRTFALPAGLDVPLSHDFSHPYYWSSFTMIGNPW